jgi:hypothetical protein
MPTLKILIIGHLNLDRTFLQGFLPARGTPDGLFPKFEKIQSNDCYMSNNPSCLGLKAVVTSHPLKIMAGAVQWSDYQQSPSTFPRGKKEK